MEIENWSMPGPKGLLLDIHQVAKAIGIGEKTILRMVAGGEFPEGKLTGGKFTWSGSDIAAWMHLRGRFVVARVENLGQKKAKRGQVGTNQDTPKTDIEPE